jgi:hypothetical protein
VNAYRYETTCDPRLNRASHWTWLSASPTCTAAGDSQPLSREASPRLRACFPFEIQAAYPSEAVNRSHAAALKVSVPPSRFVVSRTRTSPEPLAVSTQALPPPLLKLDLRH